MLKAPPAPLPLEATEAAPLLLHPCLLGEGYEFDTPRQRLLQHPSGLQSVTRHSQESVHLKAACPFPVLFGEARAAPLQLIAASPLQQRKAMPVAKVTTPISCWRCMHWNAAGAPKERLLPVAATCPTLPVSATCRTLPVSATCHTLQPLQLQLPLPPPPPLPLLPLLCLLKQLTRKPFAASASGAAESAAAATAPDAGEKVATATCRPHPCLHLASHLDGCLGVQPQVVDPSMGSGLL